ncbi:Na+:solute symporter [Luteolibacter algae]|uniref:Na+:solute symporter n=1 Tax=Luteolibacter algae TaxID=454151 RepID=A0ABW5D5M2_9BACT
MQLTDYLVILLYVLGIVGAGLIFARKVKSSNDMFSAGGQSPWWVSGLSGFMTMFSAGTFVVWGGIAYRFGFVAVAISMCYGIAALLVGWFLAGYWRKLGVSSAAEFLRLRFGKSVVQFYTWFQGFVGILSMGGAVYALAKIISALMPLPQGHFLADPATGLLSVSFASLAICIMVILITFSGGLWAVLMTDVLQFVILTVSVIFVVPLILMKAGGLGAFIEKMPEGFASPVAEDFTWWFLIGWVLIHFFKIGGEWAFVQRYTCVPSAGDAKKSAYIFGVMYLISPIIWMMPPLVYRVINPDADFEQAYILACQMVLPAGMMGLMVAAMASATASMATTQLNVFAGAFTTELYQQLINKSASEKQLVFVGRVLTAILGIGVLIAALLIPRYGYTKFIIEITTLLTGPLVLPTIWGLFSRKIGLREVWITTFLSFLALIVLKFGLSQTGFLSGITALEPLITLVSDHIRLADLTSGIAVPFLILCILEVFTKSEHPGWQRVMASKASYQELPPVEASTMPAKMVAVTLAIVAAVMAALAMIDKAEGKILLIFSAVLLGISGVTFATVRKISARSSGRS